MKKKEEETTLGINTDFLHFFLLLFFNFLMKNKKSFLLVFPCKLRRTKMVRKKKSGKLLAKCCNERCVCAVRTSLAFRKQHTIAVRCKRRKRKRKTITYEVRIKYWLLLSSAFFYYHFQCYPFAHHCQRMRTYANLFRPFG